MAAHHINQRRCAAFVGNVIERNTGTDLEQFERHVLHAARAGRGPIETLFCRLCQSNQFGYCVRFYRRMHHQQIRHSTRQKHRLKIPRCVIRQRGKHRRIDGVAGRVMQNYVAVSLRLRYQARADRA